jgi:uncharacterized membrane protein YbhN (UPF0104 family)
MPDTSQSGRRGRLSRRRRLIALIGALVGIGLIAIVIVPRADDVRQALSEVGAGKFVLIVLLGFVSLIFRSGAWQVAIDAAGGRLRLQEAHLGSSTAFAVGLLSPYLGVAARIAVIRDRVPERSPTSAEQVAAESVLIVVEAAIVGTLVLLSSWTLDVQLGVALLIFLGGVGAIVATVLLARRFAERRFGAGLAVARQPKPLLLVILCLAATVGTQIARVAVTLGSVGLDTSPLIVIAVYLASGAGAVIPIGTAASGAAAPLLAVHQGGNVSDAAAAGVLLTGSLMVACLAYLLIALAVAASSGLLGRREAGGA